MLANVVCGKSKDLEIPIKKNKRSLKVYGPSRVSSIHVGFWKNKKARATAQDIIWSSSVCQSEQSSTVKCLSVADIIFCSAVLRVKEQHSEAPQITQI